MSIMSYAKKQKPREARFNLPSQAENYLHDHNVDISVSNKTVTMRSYGLKIWGTIDYLVNFHGYSLRKVN